MRLAALSVNHIGITVPDIYAAMKWYSEVFGLTHLMGPRLITAESSEETRTVFGPEFKSMLQAHLVSGNGVGFELFEPIEPKPQPPEEAIPYLRGGMWHIAVMHPDVDALVDRIVQHGGRMHSPPTILAPGRPWRLAYTRDPWWTTIEIVSHSYAEMFGSWPQPGSENPFAIIDEKAARELRHVQVPSIR